MLLQLLQRFQASLKASIIISGAIALIIPLSLILMIALHSRGPFIIHWQLRHLRRLGVTASNMADQCDPKYNIPEGAQSGGPIRIKAIYIRPIKSCGHIEVHRALLTKSGFMYDRCFAFAMETGTDANVGMGWRFISQRTNEFQK